MHRRTLPLAIVVVLTALAVGVGGAAADPADARSLAPRDDVNNTTTDGEYRGYEPSRNWTDKPVLETEISGDGASASGSGSGSASDASEGTTRKFLTVGPQGYRLTTFELREVGEHIEVWVAADLSWGVAGDRPTPSISEAQVEHIAEEFDENIYPKESELFGKPKPRDGSDALLGPEGYYNTTENAGNKTVLLVQNIRDKNYYDPSYPLYIAGYYSPTVQQYSDRNVITIDAYGWSNVTEEDPMVGYEGTLAHEYQHLIHADLDGDETTWVNEGMSDYAEYAVGYGVPEGHVDAYEQLPSNSLTNWEDQGALNVLADYGLAYAFTMYESDEYGEDFITNLAHEDRNGIASVEATLDEVGAKRDFRALYQDFSVAAVTDDVRYPPKDAYHVDGVELNVDTSNGVKSAGAWGTAYRTVDTSETGPITGVEVAGTDFVGTQWTTADNPAPGQNGTVLYSGSGNLLDRFAIVRADISGAENPQLTFESYTRIEENWDYGFVQVSTDGGETWHSLSNSNTDATPNPSAHPTVKANLPGLTGDSDGWTTQRFDLSRFEGNESVLVAFRYTTDWAFVQPGWYVRNVSVAGQSFTDDSTAPYMSLREAQNDPVEYQFSFVGVKDNGNYQVKQLDLRTFDDEERKELDTFLHNGNFEKVIVASTWAARPGESGRVPVGVEFEFADEQGRDDG